MNQILMIIMAVGVVIGGADYMLGNRFGLGEKFAEGYRLLGPLALSMAGIICLAPTIADLLGGAILPVFHAIGVDPGIFGGVLAIDMGGCQLALELSEDPLIGRYASIVLTAIFGCTLVFTIPVGMGAIGEEDKPYFAKGLLLGLTIMPIALYIGALAAGLSFWQAFYQNLPIFLIAGLLLLGLIFIQERLVKMFAKFAKGIELVTIFGLILAAVQYLTGWEILPSLTPLETAMKDVCGIGIVMSGSIPLAELLRRALRKPFSRIGARTGMNDAAISGPLIGMVSETAALMMIKEMDHKGQVVNAAFLVCGASALAAHLGFAIGAVPEMVGPMLAAKLIGGVMGIAMAMIWLSRKK